MMLTLTLAVGLLAAPEPQTEPPKGENWIIEVRGFTKHRQAETPKDRFIIEFQWPQAKSEIEPVEGQYYDDLSAFFKQWKVQVEPVEAFYVDDLRAYIEQLKKR